MAGSKLVRVDASNAGEVIRACKAAKVVGFDTETTSLSPRDGKLRLMQLAVPGTVYILDAFKQNPRMLAPIFDGETRLAGHNLQFELDWLSSVGINLPHGKNLWDTFISRKLRTAGLMPRPGAGLDDIALEYLGYEMDKTYQTSDWSGSLSPDQLRYAAIDAAIMLQLYDGDLIEIEQAGLNRVMGLEMRFLPAMQWMAETGMPWNPEKWQKVYERYVQEVDRLEYALAVLTDTKGLLDWSTVNWRSPEQVLAQFRARGVKINDTTDDTLGELASAGDELASMLMTYRERSKRRDTYGKAWLEKHYNASTGRVYADWRQIGADRTGRMACRNPNLQNIPHTKEYRECCEAPEGYRLVIADQSQIELRIAVEMTGDPVGVQAYVHDHSDLHQATAKLILGVDPNDPDKARVKEARQVAKTLNFGLLYGAGAETLRLYAQANFNVTMDLDRASKLRNAWRKTYTGIVAWHKSIREGTEATRTLSGRRRLAVDKYTEKLNTPVQGTGADIIKAGAALMYENKHQLPADVRLAGIVHDETITLCREADAPFVKEWVQRQMIKGGEAFLKRIPVEVEAAIGRNWSDK